MAVAGTKHTILTDTNKTIHRKRASKPLNQYFRISYLDEEKTRGEKMEGLQQPNSKKKILRQRNTQKDAAHRCWKKTC